MLWPALVGRAPTPVIAPRFSLLRAYCILRLLALLHNQSGSGSAVHHLGPQESDSTTMLDESAVRHCAAVTCACGGLDGGACASGPNRSSWMGCCSSLAHPWGLHMPGPPPCLGKHSCVVHRTLGWLLSYRPSGFSFPRPLRVASSGSASQHAVPMGPPMQPQRMPAVI